MIIAKAEAVITELRCTSELHKPRTDHALAIVTQVVAL